jgi:hypothetical protein
MHYRSCIADCRGGGRRVRLRAYLHQKATENMTPEEIQAMNAFFEEPVEIP